MLCSIGVPETNKRLVTLLSDERLDAGLRWNIAKALGQLGERSVAARDLVHLLSDERLEAILRGRIADALSAYANDISIISELTKSLHDMNIFDSVYSALWTISRRARVWIFPQSKRQS